MKTDLIQFATWGRGFDNPLRSQPQASRYLWVGTRESADNPLCSTEPHIFFGLRRNSFDTQSPSPLIQSRFEGRSMSRCSFVEGSARHAAGRPAAWQGGIPFALKFLRRPAGNPAHRPDPGAQGATGSVPGEGEIDPVRKAQKRIDIVSQKMIAFCDISPPILKQAKTVKP